MSEFPDGDDEDAKVTRLPVPVKQPVSTSGFLVSVPNSACRHYRGPFEVNPDSGHCRCMECGGEVTPIFVLGRLMQKESGWKRERAAYQDEMRRLAERSSTKCNHCGKMTRISHR